MLILFSDFGLEGPYIGQVKAVLYDQSPNVPVIDLFSDAPVWDINASAHLLQNYSLLFRERSVFLAVVDPGVGGVRLPVVIQADQRWFVGPDNGLFDVIISRAGEVKKWVITWQPSYLSTSFHGRDLFAPIAAAIARDDFPEEKLKQVDTVGIPSIEDLWKVIYIDHYGNAITGIRYSEIEKACTLQVNDCALEFANTFSDVGINQPFWYCNSNGLVEIAMNQARADKALKIVIGTEIFRI